MLQLDDSKLVEIPIIELLKKIKSGEPLENLRIKKFEISPDVTMRFRDCRIDKLKLVANQQKVHLTNCQIGYISTKQASVTLSDCEVKSMDHDKGDLTINSSNISVELVCLGSLEFKNDITQENEFFSAHKVVLKNGSAFKGMNYNFGKIEQNAGNINLRYCTVDTLEITRPNSCELRDITILKKWVCEDVDFDKIVLQNLNASMAEMQTTQLQWTKNGIP